MIEYPKEKLVLRLPPSVNVGFIFNPNLHRLIRSSKYRNYIEAESWQVAAYCSRWKIKPIENYTPVYLYFYLKNMRLDAHNTEKPLFDALERGGMFKNDCFIMNRIMTIERDKENPRVEISLVPFP